MDDHTLLVSWNDLQQVREAIEDGRLGDADAQLEGILDTAPISTDRGGKEGGDA